MSSETINLGGAGSKKPVAVGGLGGLKKSNNTNFMDDEDEEDEKKGKNKFNQNDD
jgi:hypothetical protein